MPRTFADLACTDLEASTAWFADLLGRAPDAEPPGGARVWHHGEAAGLRLRRDLGRAGQGSLTLVVAAFATRHERLIALEPGEREDTGFLRVRLRDPDGNLVVMAGEGAVSPCR